VIVGDADDLVTDEFEIDGLNWICDIRQGFHGGTNSCEPGVAGAPPSNHLEVTVKIRYSHPGTRATLTPLKDGRARVRLHEPQRAVTPGQAAVLYDGDVVLGGGWICRSRHPERSPFDSLRSLRVNSAKSKGPVMVP
jgi:tRNA-specific 2-thiouridylase